MPELPEVETVKNVLIPIVKGRKILDIEIKRRTTIQGDPVVFIDSLKGETFNDISRIGKFLIFHLTNEKVLISHLRMEGKYYEFDEDEPDSKYARVVFHFDNNKKLCYDDSRCFGIMILSSEKEYRQEKEISKLGPEPFAINDVSFLLKASKGKKLPIKSNLLDQSLMTGLGNIYVDEVLYASKIHPLTPSYAVTKKEWELIVKNAKTILTTAIELGGSTIKSYHPGKDIDGNFQTRIKIYGKSGEECPECHSTYRFIKVGGRGTTFCPKCQQKHGIPLNVAITGKIASGKSTILEAFKNKGFDVLSCDEVVKNLYLNKDVSEHIEKLLGISFNDAKVDKDILRKHLIENPKDKKKLEKYVHGLVREEVEKFLLTSNSKIRVVEVPLLFESKFDMMFDTIIVTDIKEEKQLSLLKNRDGFKSDDLRVINSNNQIDQNKNKATYLISNNSSKEEFNKKCEDVISKLISHLD
ncbi:MAG: bifunctional DNA-formamidopyrimidine glycosylase/DNA-(apurinic or apyrimidinic site) lyase [Bacilli bacterium]|nr:bifunctional DNA-formamidopyrimidine glycosylase/DNA-(apurinic or apyrimidinic site) lyase [Bacilli bacterium]